MPTTLKKVLDLNPWREEKLDERLFLQMIADTPADELQTRYRFDAFDEDELYPLHMVSALGASLDCVKAAYKAHPAAMQLTDTSLGGPVHFACAFGAAMDVIQYLAKKDPEALKRPNDSGRHTPLHLACKAVTINPDVVVFLTERCPEAALMTDRDGNTPLNLACQADNPPLAAVEDLTEVQPSAGTIKARDGTWPLWNALRHDADRAVVKDLIISNPESAQLIGSAGFTALHRALDVGFHVTLILKDLTKANPKILETKDDECRLPLHYAIERDVAFPIIQLFVQRCPATVDAENGDGETPYQLSERIGRDPEIVQFLNPYDEDPAAP
jgi:ankyrin repeat protein